MLDLILFAIGVTGFGLAAYWDLRHTEFPDWLPYSMIILTVAFKTIDSVFSNDWWILINSVFIGLIFLGFGLLLYFSRQWGDGDAWLLGALGFVLPQQMSFVKSTFFPFPMTVIFNFLVVSLFYLVVYSLWIGIRKGNVNRKYFKYIRKERYKFIGATLFFFGFAWSFAFVMHSISFNLSNIIQMMLLPFFLTPVLFFSYYAKMVEKNLFKRKVKTSELKEGDVIMEGKWKGLTGKEITALRRKYKYVWIKEGVRFAPVFVITMIITIFYGDLIIIFI